MKWHELKGAISCTRSLPELFFQLGYFGTCLPRSFRKMISGTKCHRYWISGFYGGGIVGAVERSYWDQNKKPVKY